MQPPILKRLLEERAAQRPVALVTRIEDGLQCIVMPRERLGDLALNEDELERVRASLAEDRSGMIEGGYFVHVHNPPLRLILVGAVHIAQALAPMARRWRICSRTGAPPL